MKDNNVLPDPYVYKLGYIILYLPSIDIAPKLNIDNEVLYAKDKFHMSILGVKEYIGKLSKKLTISEEEAETIIMRESAKILKDNPISFSRFKDDIRLVKESDKKTIAIMCEADGVESFFNKLKKVLKIEMATQPVHSTVYTREDGRGIGMINQKELSEFSRPLVSNETIIVKKALNWDKLNEIR